jgi:catechol 2,3-dioxygenase-like lactoylglutathione lyase family enzyme
MFSLDGLDHVALTVRDQSTSMAWYRDVLGLERRYQEVWGDYPIILCAGETGVALFPATDTAKPAGGNMGFNHFAFRVSRANFEAAQASFRERGIAFTFRDHTKAHSVYLTDPDGYAVELTTYEL